MSESNTAAREDSRKPPVLPLPPATDRDKLFRWSFFGFFLFLLYQLILILSLFMDVIVWGCSLTLVFWPAWRMIHRRLPHSPNIGAGLCTLGVLLLVLIPLTAVFSIVVAQSSQLYPTMQQWLQTLQSSEQGAVADLLPPVLQGAWQRLTQLVASIPLLAGIDYSGLLLSNTDNLSTMLTDLGTATARNIFFGLITLILILTMIFFCFRDGERFMNWFFEVIPMETRHAQEVAFKVYETVTAVIRGALVTAFMQGALALIGYLIAGVPLALFFGVLTGFAALIPVVGAALIWLPIGIFIFFEEPAWGIFILLWGFFLVSLIDNLLKPVLIGSKTRMPILLVFCAMIGGANIYGVTGFLIGPIVIAVLLAFITIYREYYLPGASGSGNPGEGNGP